MTKLNQDAEPSAIAPVRVQPVVSLLHCLCGTQPIMDGGDSVFWILCPKCGKAGGQAWTRQGAARKWNKKTQQQANAALCQPAEDAGGAHGHQSKIYEQES